MSDAPLPVVVIGAGGFGGQTLSALLQSPIVKVVGLSDSNADEAHRLGKETGVPSYSDSRSLLAETRPAAAYIAVPPASAPELIAACAERGIHVWKELPLGRDLAEAAAMVRRMDSAGLKLAVGTQQRFAVGYRQAWNLRKEIGGIFLARANYLFNWGENLGWRGDRESAGGGALLEIGYHAIDLLVWMLSIPSEVYGISARGNRPTRIEGIDTTMPVYDTDDTAVIVLRYASGAMGTVVTTRSSGPLNEDMFLHGRCGSLRANGQTCMLRDPDGNTLEHAGDEPAAIGVFRRQAESFASAVISGGDKYECSGWENMLNMAVIEAAYLSDRTAQPEDPQRLLKTHDITVEQCLQHARIP